MRQTYRGYFRPRGSSEELTWKTFVFVLDANILLNFYRYSDSTKNEFLRCIERMKDKIWLPYQAGLEFLENRIPVIVQQEKLYVDATKKIDELLASFEHTRQHPFVAEQSLKSIKHAFIILKEELEKNKKISTDRISDDEIQEWIVNIFEGRVGCPFTLSDLTKIHEEGAERYRDRIPPGYMDKQKSEGALSIADKNRQFGDFLIWKEIIDFGLKYQKDVAFITDDRKEDWWKRISGRTIGPRPELIDEFFEKTGRSFEMYEAHYFFETSNKLLKLQSRPKVVEEIKEVSRRRRVTSGVTDDVQSDKIIGHGLESRNANIISLKREKLSVQNEINAIEEILNSNETNSMDTKERQFFSDLLSRLYNKLSNISFQLGVDETSLLEEQYFRVSNKNKLHTKYRNLNIDVEDAGDRKA